MFAKLAFRNVKRQIGNYLIYFITVSITVALMFALNNVIFGKELLEKASQSAELKTALIVISLFVAVIVAFVLGYATSFMLKLRKREFGTYLTLGMTRKNILSIFLLESLILCAASLLTGIFLGLFLYQGLSAVLSNLLETEYAFAAYSMQGLLFTAGLVLGLFVLSSITSAVYLNKVRIYHLLHGEKMVEKKVKQPVVWSVLALISLIAIVASCFVCYNAIDGMFTQGEDGAGALMLAMIILALSVIVFHVALAKSLVNLLLKNKRFCNKGTNTFALRQLSGKLGANALMAGFLAFLITFAVIGSNVSFTQKVSMQASLNAIYPFDIGANLDVGEDPKVPFAEAEATIAKYSTIEGKYAYQVYTSGNDYLHSFTRWSGDGYGGLTDSFMLESDYNILNAALGREQIDLNEQFLLISRQGQIANYDFSTALLSLGGQTLTYGGISNKMPVSMSTYFVAIVPDSAVGGLTPKTDGRVYKLKEGKFDAMALEKELSYEYTSENGFYTYERCDYLIKESARIHNNSETAVFVISALYIAVIFVFLAMAILALKTLSSLSEDKQRYGILYRLGAGKGEQSKTLFAQILSFFALPFAVPILLTIPACAICTNIMRWGGFAVQAGQLAAISGIIALVMVAIYGLYFTATYLIAKKNVVRISA